MSAMLRRLAAVRASLVVALVCTSACIWRDPGGGTTPIESLPLDERAPLTVSTMRNETPNAIVAGFTRGSTVLLEELLRTTRRFVVVDSAAPAAAAAGALRLDTEITSYRDEDAGASVIYLQAQSANRRRRAAVEMHWSLVGKDGSIVDQGTVAGNYEQLDVREIAVPQPESMESGAYWNSPFGRATRDCLDGIVRRISERRP